MVKKKIAIYTGSRADYEILKPLILALYKFYKIYLFVGPHHYEKKFGNTINIIKKDKIKVYYKCSTTINYDNVDVSKFVSNSVYNYKKKLDIIKPDLVIILGDRYEVLSFVIASFFLNLKIAHLNGGDITYGSFDDTIRHMISKMSDYHFVTNNIYKNRLISMGEIPKNIYNFGSIAAFNVKKIVKSSKSKIFKKYKIPLKSKLVIVTFHPETNSSMDYYKQINTFLTSIKKVNKYFYFFTSSNADPYGKYFNTQIEKFVKKNKNSIFVQTLGSKDYFSLINYSEFVLGNSSSGIYEVPILKKVTINVGSRQSGRLMPISVINCKLNILSLTKVLNNFYSYKKKIKFKNIFFKDKIISKMKSKIKILTKIRKKIKIFYEKKNS